MLRVHSDRHFVLEHDPRRGLAVAIRSAEPFADLEAMAHAFAALSDALDRLDRRRIRLLVDMRAARGRNDPAFEVAMKPLRRGLLAGCARVGILVRSAVGRLQLQRHLREDGIEALVEADEEALVAALGDPP